MNFYNDNDIKSAQWVRELVAQKHLPHGYVSHESIQSIQAPDLTEFTQCHFFAGIGGWSLALRLAGWPAKRPVWTGSCPCQPFSSAGKQRGEADERHLWPEFFRLIRECRPPTIFGEQVASKLGREWLARVFTDLESLGYAVAGADLCAAGVGAPHIRQRLFWVANANGAGCAWPRPPQPEIRPADSLAAWASAVSDGLGHPNGQGSQGHCNGTGGYEQLPVEAGAVGGVEHAPSDGWEQRWAESSRRSAAGRCSEGPWSYYLAHCTDGKTRRIGTGIQPLAHGVPGRVGLLRGYGNAIVPQVAAAFVKSFMDIYDAH